MMAEFCVRQLLKMPCHNLAITGGELAIERGIKVLLHLKSMLIPGSLPELHIEIIIVYVSSDK